MIPDFGAVLAPTRSHPESFTPLSASLSTSAVSQEQVTPHLPHVSYDNPSWHTLVTPNVSDDHTDFAQ